MTPGADDKQTSWAAIGALMAAGVMAAAQVGKVSAALPFIQADFGLTLTAAAWFLSIVSLVGAAGGVVIGALGHRIGLRRQVQLGLLTIVGMNVAGAAAHSASLLMVTRAGEGLGFALVVLAAPALLGPVTAPRHARLVSGAWGAYMPVGTGAATVVVPHLAPAIGWRDVWLVGSLVAAGVLAAVTRSVPRDVHQPSHRIGGSLAPGLRDPGVLCLTGVFALYAAQYLAVLALLPTVLLRDGAMTTTAAGAATGLAFLANAPGNLLGAVLQHRGVPRPLLVIGGSVCMGFFVWGVYGLELPTPYRVAAAVLFSFTAGAVPSAAFGGVAALTSGTPSAASAMGTLMQGSSIGQLLGPPLLAFTAATVTSPLAPPATLCALAVAAAVCGVIYGRVEERRFTSTTQRGRPTSRAAPWCRAWT